MNPPFSIYNVADRGNVNTKFFSQLDQKSPRPSFVQHGTHLNIRKLRVVMILAVLVIWVFGLSSLGKHVAHVVGIGAKKEVIGVNAEWVVALVKNVHVFGSRATVDNPRSSMSKDGFTARSAYSNVPVPMTVFSCPRPQPTRCEHREMTWDCPGLGYLFPESFKEVVGKSLLSKIFFGRFVSHNQSLVGCATLRAALTAPRHFLVYSLTPTQSILR